MVRKSDYPNGGSNEKYSFCSVAGTSAPSGVIVLFVQIDTVHGLKTKICPILSEGIALPLNNRLERINLLEKYDYR